MILIIEDDTRIADWVKVFLEDAGFSAEIANDGMTGLSMARNLEPELIILDLMLPGMNGMDICKTLRQESAIPIIMLTARDARSDRVDGLQLGADDYVVKPFDPEELVARVKAVLRRVKGKVQQVLTVGSVSIDESTLDVSVDGLKVLLSKAQFSLLSVLMRHPGQVLSRYQLIELAFDGDFEGYDRAIDTQIMRLRKLMNVRGTQPIQTVYGAGYRFMELS